MQIQCYSTIRCIKNGNISINSKKKIIPILYWVGEYYSYKLKSKLRFTPAIPKTPSDVWQSYLLLIKDH